MSFVDAANGALLHSVHNTSDLENTRLQVLTIQRAFSYLVNRPSRFSNCILRCAETQERKVDVTKMGEACLTNSTNPGMPLAGLYGASIPAETLPWYALKVRTRSEALTCKALEGRGFAPFYPTHQERRRYSDRMKVVETALFPGYVFCQFDAGHRIPVISCPGVESIVGVAGTPITISEEEIENIRRVAEAGGCATPYLAKGQRVRVTHGALAGVEGLLASAADGDRLIVSINLLNRSASLNISRDHVDPI